ncbi:ABC transporter permease subunit [Roseovarius sp. 2305UL8-3]|uniref:ABC transporter permease subunit n=1 Tax=Roseovarius conchicola TaxID=3121636 RepID=UPI003526D47D
MMDAVKTFVSRGNFVILVALIVVASLVSEHFWTLENIMNVIRAASLIGIIAIGMNVVIIGGGIDLSVGSVVALTGAVAASFWVADAPFWLFLVVPLLVALTVGFANGALVSWLGLQPFVATLVLMTIARGAGLVYTGGQPVYADYPDVFMILSRGVVFGVPVASIIFLGLTILTWYIMRWRVFGREVYAIGANETAARLSGVNVSRVKFKTYLYCALLAGLSGLVLTSRMESGEPGQAGIFWELDAIAAVVIGGTSIRGGSGSVWGAFVGALIIGIVANLFNLLGVGPAWQQVAKGAIIIFAVMLQALSDRGTSSLKWRDFVPSFAGFGTWVKPLAAVAGLLVILNGTLYATVYPLFQIDLAKAPYTRANNLELTRVYHRAIPLYEQVIERFPDSNYALLSRIGIANSARGGGDLELAESSYAILLEEVTSGAIPENLRFDILRNYVVLLQETGNGEKFEEVFALLEADFPDADATREGRVYLEQLRAAAEVAQTGGIPENAPVIVTADGVSLPETVKLGERFDLTITLEANGDQSADFSIMTALNFWKGFRLIKASPNPRSNTEFWGRRAWTYGQISEPLTVVATLEAIKAGEYRLDLDIERSFDVLEFGIVKTITVEE